jgi:cyclopropane fatty-acyl-phospholipid synthase-like methyltransferase
MKSKELYDLHSAATIGLGSVPGQPALRNLQMTKLLRQRVESWDIVRVLELGFGDAELSRVIASALPQARITACDISKARVEDARKAAAHAGLAGRVEYRQLDFDSDLEQFPAASADVVVTIDVLEHVFDVFGFVRHLARLTRPNGLVLLRVPNLAYVKHRLTLARGGLPVTSSWFGPAGDLSAWRATWGWDGGHLHSFTLSTLDKLLRDFGLQPLAWGDPGTRFESIRRRVPALFCGNLCVLAERVK